MGILLADAKHLVSFWTKHGPEGPKKVLTLGRQQIFFDPHDLFEHLTASGIPREHQERFAASTHDTGPSEPLFKLLGAEQVTALDVSDYEGATLRHDLNLSIPPHLHESFDLVFDGGTLEHVFNFPVAIRSAMELVRIGGTLILSTPGNNQMGHGFYQFSPELFFGALSEQNGFVIEKMLAIEISPSHREFSVANPTAVRERVTLSGTWPVELFIIARRVRRTELFKNPPQQSDYTVKWGAQLEKATHSVPRGVSSSGVSHSNARSRLRKKINLFLLKYTPRLVQWASTFKRVYCSSDTEFKNSRHFKRVD